MEEYLFDFALLGFMWVIICVGGNGDKNEVYAGINKSKIKMNFANKFKYLVRIANI